MNNDNPQPIHAEPATLLALVIFTLVSLGLGVVANLVSSKKAGFLQKYFLGNRSLGAFAVALTAAVVSGGTFVGFPSLAYKHGWVIALWIASYMVVPLTVLGILGKRIGQLARRTGAITLPDLLRERYGSPALGLLTSLLIMLFLTSNLIPQFKAGGVIMKMVLPAGVVSQVVDEGAASTDVGYYLGLAVFAATVVAYTAYGGFLAAIWTDVFQSIIMALGVLILFPLAMMASGGLSAATEAGIAQTDIGFAFGPGAGKNFHPIGLAFSFFFMWAITGMGQPSTMVRLMSFRDSRTLRFSIIYMTIYNLMIYIPLVFIFIAARAIVPDLARPDEVMPSLVIKLANPYIAGLILAAPYGAVMSTVSGFLLIISSGIVRDVYQRFIRPQATEKEIEWASYSATVLVGIAVTLIALRPPEYLQLIIVFSSTGMAASFLMPVLLGAFWPRATHQGALAGMLFGALSTLALYGTGYAQSNFTAFSPYDLLGLDPCVWGLLASLIGVIVGSLLTPPPDPARIALLFEAQPPNAPAPATLDLHPDLARTIAPEEG
jgi:SSS family solute:Na+ symporter/sodium/pantothenate symporter